MIPYFIYVLPLYPLVAQAALEVDLNSRGEHISFRAVDEVMKMETL